MAERAAYDISLKLRAVEHAEKTMKEAAVRQFGVDVKRIREWCSQKDQLLSMANEQGKEKRKCLTGGGGRKALDNEMEEAVFSWIVDLRSRNLCVHLR